MPRSMLISRKRQTNAINNDQPAPTTSVPSQCHDLFKGERKNSTDCEGDEDEDEQTLAMDCDTQQQSQVQTTIQPHEAQPSSLAVGATGGVPDPQVDTLTNAITFFLSLLSQQQLQTQQAQSQQPQNLLDGASIAIAQNTVRPNNVKPTTHTKRSSASQKSSKLVNQARIQEQLQVKRQQQLAIEAANIEQHLQQHTQQLFLTNEDLTDPQLSNQSNQSKRSCTGSGSGSGSDDNFVHYCVDCGKRYSTSSNLARHRQTHRDVTDKKAKKCPECDKIYVSMPAFSMHLRTHNQGCICSICGKSFSRPWLLQGHMRTHTGEKPFRCRICNKAFADKSNLRAHIQTHSTTKPFVCNRCNKAFALKSYLCKHVDSTCMRANSSQKEPLNLKILNHARRSRSNNG